jgi:hypothetical protein
MGNKTFLTTKVSIKIEYNENINPHAVGKLLYYLGLNSRHSKSPKTQRHPQKPSLLLSLPTPNKPPVWVGIDPILDPQLSHKHGSSTLFATTYAACLRLWEMIQQVGIDPILDPRPVRMDWWLNRKPLLSIGGNAGHTIKR